MEGFKSHMEGKGYSWMFDAEDAEEGPDVVRAAAGLREDDGAAFDHGQDLLGDAAAECNDEADCDRRLSDADGAGHEGGPAGLRPFLRCRG